MQRWKGTTDIRSRFHERNLKTTQLASPINICTEVLHTHQELLFTFAELAQPPQPVDLLNRLQQWLWVYYAALRDKINLRNELGEQNVVDLRVGPLKKDNAEPMIC